jgi:tetratricopeptide (TPR) repeat protein
MAAEYDIFFSHAWADGDRPQQIANALTRAGLRVWFDAAEINDFDSITRTVTEGLAQSKALLAYYSKTYPLRRACQWELTAAFLAAQTEGDPRRRVLVISPEERSDHIHPVELRDAKFRTTPGADGVALQELAQSIVKHVAQLKGPLPDTHPLTAPNWYGMAPVGSARFVGRLAEMWQVHSLLHAADVVQITGAVVNVGQVSGLGGVGKSLLAEEYALHFGAAYPGGVFWLRAYGNDNSQTVLGAEEREALRTGQMRDMAERLGINAQGMSAAQIEGALKGEIERRGKDCLWVVDDVPNGLNGDALRGWFAPHALARTLITTRSREYRSLANGIDLSVLAPEEAYQLLTSHKLPLGEDEQARELAKDLGYHALALDVTAAALVEYGGDEPYRKFRDELAGKEEDALELSIELSDALPNGHEKSIAQTMLRSIRGLGTEGLDFLRLASVLALAPIPASLVTAVFERTDDLDHGTAEQRQRRAFHDVTSASLAEVAGEKQDARTVHTLVSRAVRFQDKVARERAEALRSAAVVALREEISKAALDPRLHEQIEFQVAHGRWVVSIPTTVPEAGLVGWVAQYDDVRGAYAAARRLHEREFEFRSREQGPEHPDTLTSMNNLAENLRAQGDLVGARKLQGEVLAIRRRVLGLEHPQTLTAMNNLALTLGDEGYLAEALKLHEETLTLRDRVLGPEHPHTLQSMGNLASALVDKGDLAAARALEEQVLQTRRRLLGPEHPDVLASMNNLAMTLHDQGNLSEASRLLEETLAIRRRVQRPEHPDTLSSMSNLAENLRAEGDLVGARKLQEEVLAIRRRLLGPEHPDTLSSMSNLAATLLAQGDLAGAGKLQEETLTICRRVLGPEHPDSLQSMNNLAGTLLAQGDFGGARKLQEEVLQVVRKDLGPEHPKTTISAWNLLCTLTGLGAPAAVRAILDRDLLWMLDRDPATLSADQRKIREYVARVVKDYVPTDKTTAQHSTMRHPGGRMSVIGQPKETTPRKARPGPLLVECASLMEEAELVVRLTCPMCGARVEHDRKESGPDPARSSRMLDHFDITCKSCRVTWPLTVAIQY